MPNQQGCALTGRDLSVLEDQLTHMATASRVAENCAAQFQNPQLRQLAQTVAQHHRQHFDAMLAYLTGCQ